MLPGFVICLRDTPQGVLFFRNYIELSLLRTQSIRNPDSTSRQLVMKVTITC